MLAEAKKATAVFQTLLDHSSEIIIFLSRDFKILEFNKRAERFYDWKREKVLRKDFVALCSSYQYDCPVDQTFFARPEHPFEVKSTVSSFYGQLQAVSWSISSNFSSGPGEVAIVLMGKSLCFKEDQSHPHSEGVSVGGVGSLYWKDKEGRYLGCNDYMRRLTNCDSIDDVIDKTDYDLWPEQADQLVQNDQYVIKTEKTLYAEEVVQTADGNILLFTSHKMPLRNKRGEIVGVIGNSVDITRLSSPEKHKSLNTTFPNAALSSAGRILLVEDDVLTQKASIAKLKKFHQMIDVVATGRQAVEQIKKRSYQLIYMDLSLPDMPGYAATQLIREWEEAEDRDAVPILAMTERVDQRNKEHCLNAGMNFVLEKPLTDESVEKMLVTFVIDRSFVTAQSSAKRGPRFHKVIDLSLGEKLVGGDGKAATQMLELLAQELPKNRKRMEEAFEEENAERLREVVFQLYGSLSSCGVPRLRMAVELMKVSLGLKSMSLDVPYRKLCTEIDIFLDTYESSL